MLEATDELARKWRFTRDDAFQIVGIEAPGEGRVEQAFDAKGRRTRRGAEDGSAEQTEFDEQGRVERRVFSGPAAGAELRLEWDELGRVASLSDPLLTERRTFEPGFGWTRVELTPAEPLGKAAAFTLHRTRLSHAVEAQQLGDSRFVLDFDFDGQPARVQHRGAADGGVGRDVLVFEYDGARQLTRLTRGNGTSTVRSYDEWGRVVQQEERTPAGTTRLSWTWDDAGRPATQTIGESSASSPR